MKKIFLNNLLIILIFFFIFEISLRFFGLADLRGHGKTAGELKNVGHFATRNGWEKVCKDIVLITEDSKAPIPPAPQINIFLFLILTLSIACNTTLNGSIIAASSELKWLTSKI